MMLQERKLLNVHETIDTYIPNFSNGNRITIHHLLTHTSGIPNYYKNWDSMVKANNLEEMISASGLWNLEFEPGSKYSYSNTGYLLLAYIIEKVSAKPFDSFIVDAIFKPLKMNNSGSIKKGLVIKNKATGYICMQDSLYTAPLPLNPETLVGNGDLYSCLDDMYAWDQALQHHTLLSKESMESMFSPYVVFEKGHDRAHGYGWFIDKKYGKRIVEYSGAIVGFLSKVIRFIDDKITIVIVTNVENREQFEQMCDEIPALLFEEKTSNLSP